MKKRKSLFSALVAICFLVIAALALVAGAMTVNTLLVPMQAQMTVAHEMATQVILPTAMVQTDPGFAALTTRGQFVGQFTPFAVAEVPEPYNNIIFVSVFIKGKGTLAGQDTKNIYLLKTVMVENQGGMSGIASRLATTATQTLKI